MCVCVSYHMASIVLATGDAMVEKTKNKKRGQAHVVLILMKFSLVENININWIKNIIVVFLRLQNGQKFLV